MIKLIRHTKPTKPWILFPRSNSNGLLFYLIALTVLFSFFEIAVFTRGSELYFGDFEYISKHIAIPWRVIPGIIFFVFVQLLLHLFFVVWIWQIAYFIGLVFRLKKKSTEFLGIVIWIFAVITVLLANQYLFINSKFADITSIIVSKNLIHGCLLFFLISCFLMQCLALYGIFLFNRYIFSVFIFIFLGFIFYHFQKSNIDDFSSTNKPNIIFIGVDALRPDFLGFFGNSNNLTPHLDEFFERSTVFSESLSPIARTFPAWMSILTGEYPKIHSLRTDLIDKKDFDPKETLSTILQKNGYETIFATDDSRFSNISKRLGFDKIIAPSFGLNNFLVGTMNDFPLSNLLVNTRIGAYLLSYSHSNRAVYTTYNPDTFIQDLQLVLNESRNKPLFLAVHFCLAHYPYVWADQLWKKQSFLHYRSAVQRVDQQVADFLTVLQKNQLLKHAILIVLSDHGEALQLAGDRVTEEDLFISDDPKFIPHFYPGATVEKINRSGGHGTDVLSMSQYHIVLAFQYFGLEGQQASVVPGRVSLLDIKPTILQNLGISGYMSSGRSLVDYISGNQSQVNDNEHFFTESDFSPDSVRTVYPETRTVVFQGLEYFQINPLTTHLTVKPSMLQRIISSKQYADFYGPWVLALYPQNHQWMMPILVNLETGEWTNDLRTPFAKKAPTRLMLDAMKSFFKEDLKEIIYYSS